MNVVYPGKAFSQQSCSHSSSFVVEGELGARGDVLLGEEGEVVDLLVRMVG